MSVTAPAGEFFTLTDNGGLPSTPAEFMAIWLASMQTAFPGYNPVITNASSPPMEYVQAQIFAQWASDVAQQCALGGTDLFINYGVQMAGLAYEQGASASTVVTVTAVDTNGYTLPATTQLTLTVGGTLAAFQTTAPLVIPAGQQSGQVVVAAIAAGSALNGATNPAQVITPVNWIASITAVAPASNGVDQEDDDAYVVRLAGYVQSLGFATATAPAFSTRAMNFQPAVGTDQEEVGRAVSIDGYSPAASTFVVTENGSASLAVTTPPTAGVTAAPGAQISGSNIPASTIVEFASAATIVMSQAASGSGSNETVEVQGTLGNQRTITLCVTDSGGNALNADTLAALTTYLQGFREEGFVINVVTPAYATIYVEVAVVAEPGFLADTVQSNVQAALLAYLSPANFNLPSGALTGWINSQSIYQSRVMAIIQNAQGVDHVVDGSLTLGTSASPTGTTDLLLSGAFPLPTSSTSSIPTTAITVQTQ